MANIHKKTDFYPESLPFYPIADNRDNRRIFLPLSMGLLLLNFQKSRSRFLTPVSFAICYGNRTKSRDRRVSWRPKKNWGHPVTTQRVTIEGDRSYLTTSHVGNVGILLRSVPQLFGKSSSKRDLNLKEQRPQFTFKDS